jgi:hypothetical protein
MIDHLVCATPDLDGTVAELGGRSLTLSPGGAHDGLGTRLGRRLLIHQLYHHSPPTT